MAYLYESESLGSLGESTNLTAPSRNGVLTPFVNLIRALAPILALVAVGFLVWWILKRTGVLTRSNSRRRNRSRNRTQNNATRTLGGWDPKQADSTRQRELRRLVAEDGYAKVVRRLTLTKNTNGKLKRVVDADLDYLAAAEGRA